MAYEFLYCSRCGNEPVLPSGVEVDLDFELRVLTINALITDAEHSFSNGNFLSVFHLFEVEQKLTSSSIILRVLKCILDAKDTRIRVIEGEGSKSRHGSVRLTVLPHTIVELSLDGNNILKIFR